MAFEQVLGERAGLQQGLLGDRCRGVKSFESLLVRRQQLHRFEETLHDCSDLADVQDCEGHLFVPLAVLLDGVIVSQDFTDADCPLANLLVIVRALIPTQLFEQLLIWPTLGRNERR
jgi:hypothetical protein